MWQMKFPTPRRCLRRYRRYRLLLAARRERARRNHRRWLRHEIARCERLLDRIAEMRGVATGKLKRRLLARFWMRTLVRVAKLDVELMMAP